MFRPKSDYLYGILITLLGVMILSPDSLCIRLAGEDVWAVAFWRSAVAVPVILALRMVFQREMPLRLHQGTLLLALIFAVSNFSFVLAIRNMGAANVLVILAATPLIAALGGWLFIRDKLPLSSWIAVVLGGLGVALAASGEPRALGGLGIAAALIVAFGLAFQFILLRTALKMDVLLALALGNLAVALASLMAGDPLAMPWDQMRWAIVAGAIISPFSFALITLGPRYLPAAEVSLLMLLEAVLGPLFVWMGGFESPDAQALFGGLVVCTAMTLMIFGKLWRRPV